jgi:hypothetical protein
MSHTHTAPDDSQLARYYCACISSSENFFCPGIREHKTILSGQFLYRVEHQSRTIIEMLNHGAGALVAINDATLPSSSKATPTFLWQIHPI